MARGNGQVETKSGSVKASRSGTTFGFEQGMIGPYGVVGGNFCWEGGFKKVERVARILRVSLATLESA